MRHIGERRRSSRWCRPGRVAPVGYAVLLALSVGCSNIMELSYTPERMDPGPAHRKAREVSDRLLKIAGITGEVEEPGMRTTVCDEYGDDLFSVQHPWSVGGLTYGQVDTGMRNLREALAESGWKVEFQELGSEIHARNEKEHFTVTVTARAATLGGKPALDFSVDSRCYRAASHSAANVA
ncbi:hypothetical protein ACFXPI_29370 [Streptomyces sp. NPDC059104]|uniref:hypothetical protein n=1 Tax=Streptomyces sp. NPDC059104 TaxID=3346729 RepID=UPI0036AEC9B7